MAELWPSPNSSGLIAPGIVADLVVENRTMYKIYFENVTLDFYLEKYPAMKEVYNVAQFVWAYLMVYTFLLIVKHFFDRYADRKNEELTKVFLEEETEKNGGPLPVLTPEMPGYPSMIPVEILRYQSSLKARLLRYSAMFLVCSALHAYYQDIWTFWLLCLNLHLFAVLRSLSEVVIIFYSFFGIHIHLMYLFPDSVRTFPQETATAFKNVIFLFVVLKELFMYECLIWALIFNHDLLNGLFYCYVGLHMFLYFIPITTVLTRFFPYAVPFSKLKLFNQQHLFQVDLFLILKFSVIPPIIIFYFLQEGSDIKTELMVLILVDVFSVSAIDKMGDIWYHRKLFDKLSNRHQAPLLSTKDNYELVKLSC